MSLKKKEERLKKRIRAKQQSMFFEPKNKWLAEIVSIESPHEAQVAIDSLEREFDAAKKRSKKVAILRAEVLEANRAEGMKMRVGPKRRAELDEIATMYRRSANKCSAVLAERDRLHKEHRRKRAAG